MRMAALAVVAMLTGLVTPASAQQWGAAPSPRIEAATARAAVAPAPQPSADSIITGSHIARLRTTLKLTPAQQAYWAPVEVALSELARQQARGEAAGFTHKLSDRSSAIAATSMQLRRIKAIALPLIQSLDDNQKRDAIALGHSMGLQHLVAAF